MSDLPPTDYSALDKPEILHHIFYPRQEWRAPASPSSRDISIPVDRDIAIVARFHHADRQSPTILFFHGNGEVVSDYDDLGPLYSRMGINFLVVDYRGYGSSGGSPSVSAMMSDCLAIYEFSRKWLAENGYTGPFMVMGRSLGSASALELAWRHPDVLDGLIIESGFAYAEPLLQLLGVDLRKVNLSPDKAFHNTEKIKAFHKPVLIIHAEFDHIIPFSDARALYNASVSSDKTLLRIPGANHNDIFLRGLTEYMASVKSFSDRIRAGKAE